MTGWSAEADPSTARRLVRTKYGGSLVFIGPTFFSFFFQKLKNEKSKIHAYSLPECMNIMRYEVVWTSGHAEDADEIPIFDI